MGLVDAQGCQRRFQNIQAKTNGPDQTETSKKQYAGARPRDHNEKLTLYYTQRGRWQG